MARHFTKASSQYITEPANGAHITTGTWAAWVWLDSTPGAYPNFATIVTLDAAATNSNYTLEYEGTHVSFDYTVSGVYCKYQATIALNNSTWYHILVATDFTLAGTTIYVNGVSQTVNRSTGADGTPDTISQPVAIAAFQGATTCFLDGRLADVAAWSGIKLTAGEALGLARGARPNTIRRASLAYFLPLDGLASPEPDLSGLKQNGTLHATPTLAAGPPMGMLTPRRPQFTELAAVAATDYRRTISPVGTRAGSRQTQQWGG